MITWVGERAPQHPKTMAASPDSGVGTPGPTESPVVTPDEGSEVSAQTAVAASSTASGEKKDNVAASSTAAREKKDNVAASSTAAGENKDNTAPSASNEPKERDSAAAVLAKAFPSPEARVSSAGATASAKREQETAPAAAATATPAKSAEPAAVATSTKPAQTTAAKAPIVTSYNAAAAAAPVAAAAAAAAAPAHAPAVTASTPPVSMVTARSLSDDMEMGSDEDDETDHVSAHARQMGETARITSEHTTKSAATIVTPAPAPPTQVGAAAAVAPVLAPIPAPSSASTNVMRTASGKKDGIDAAMQAFLEAETLESLLAAFQHVKHEADMQVGVPLMSKPS
jgi:hypothetical protein